MKNLIYYFVIITISMFVSSCHDDFDLDNQENTVEYMIVSDNPDATIHVDATELGEKGVNFKKEFTNKCTTTDYFVVVKAKCDDPVVVITVDVSVNGRHIKTVKGNSPVFISERLKGTGPYLQ